MNFLVSMGLPEEALAGALVRPRQAVLRELNWSTGRVMRERRWLSDPQAHGEHSEFTAGVIHDGVLLQTTRTELLWIELKGLTVIERLSHPLFHDLHDVCVLDDGGFAVSATGIESVLVFSRERKLLIHHWLREGDFGAAYEGVADFRPQPFNRFKPHSHHPNHCFVLKGRLWTTVFERSEAVELDGPGRIFFNGQHPHDGRWREGLLWFTTVEGAVWAFNESLERVVYIDINVLEDDERLPGWCRGIEVIGDRLWVGFTMLRASRLRELLRVMVRGRSGEKRPTRIVEIDWRRRVILSEIPIGNDAGGTLYGINRL